MKESKILKELHAIREKMSKLSDAELLKELEDTRHKYKDYISECEHKSRKLEVGV